MDFIDSVKVLLNQPIERNCRICKTLKPVNQDYLCYECWDKLNPIGDNQE